MLYRVELVVLSEGVKLVVFEGVELVVFDRVSCAYGINGFVFVVAW